MIPTTDVERTSLMKPTMSDIQAVLDKFDQSEWNELRVSSDNFNLLVSKSPLTERSGSSSLSDPPRSNGHSSEVTTVHPPTSAEIPISVTQEISAGPRSPETEGVVVKAPSLGTFYRAPKPGAAPFVEVGSEVEPSTQLCLLEVMKLYTSVEAGAAGVVTEILVEDGTLVEHDQPLFVVRPCEGE